MFFGLFRRRSPRRDSPVRPAEPPAPWSPRPSPGDLGRSDLADETEAFLHGHLADLRAATGGSLAAWMVLNRICHGDSVDIFTMAVGDLSRASLPRVHAAYLHVWNGAQRSIATRVLEQAMDPSEIRRIQHDVLIPLELELLRRADEEPLTFPQVTAATLEALDHHHLDR